MLKFGRGLRIIFDDGLKRCTGIIMGPLGPVDENSCYLVNIYECGELSDKDSIVSDNQILQVYIKNIHGRDIWVKIDALRKFAFDGSTIKPDTIYNNPADERNSGRYPWGEYAKRYMVNDEKAVKDAINSVWGYRNIPKPKKVIFNGPATIVIWQDGTKTVVKKSEDDTDDREKAVMYAILKKEFGSRAKMNRYLKQFKEVESNEEKEN